MRASDAGRDLGRERREGPRTLGRGQDRRRRSSARRIRARDDGNRRRRRPSAGGAMRIASRDGVPGPGVAVREAVRSSDDLSRGEVPRHLGQRRADRCPRVRALESLADGADQGPAINWVHRRGHRGGAAGRGSLHSWPEWTGRGSTRESRRGSTRECAGCEGREPMRGEVGERRGRGVLRGEDGGGGRPVDPERGVVPEDASLVARGVELGAFIEDEGRPRSETDEAVGKPGRDEDLVLVLGGERHADPLPEGRATRPRMSTATSNTSPWRTETSLPCDGRPLVMEPAEDAPARGGEVVLHEPDTRGRPRRIAAGSRPR